MTLLIDTLCSFQAPQRVTVGRRQGKLGALAGIMYYMLMVLIAIFYLVVYQIMMSNNHLKYEAPVGSVRLQLRRPTVFDETVKHMCSPQNEGCLNDFKDVKQLPYCERSKMDYANDKLPCKIWDEDSVVARNQGNDVLIATHVKEWDQTKLCDGSKGDSKCAKTFSTKQRDNYFLADVENFAVIINHAMRTPAIIPEMSMMQKCDGILVCQSPPEDEGDGEDAGGAKEKRMLTVQGEGVSVEAERRLGGEPAADKAAPKGAGAAPAPPPPAPEKKTAWSEHWQRAKERLRKQLKKLKKRCFHIQDDPMLHTNQAKHADVFKLSTLLNATGVDLDKPSSSSRDGLPRRDVGTTLLLSIHYENTKPWETWYQAFPGTQLPIRYHYTIKELPVREYKVRDSHWEDSFNGAKRMVLEQHGIRIMINMTGKVGTFSISAFVTLCMVSVTMIFMAEKIVILFVRFFPVWLCEGKDYTGVTQAHIANNIVSYAKEIEGSWKSSFETKDIKDILSEAEALAKKERLRE